MVGAAMNRRPRILHEAMVARLTRSTLKDRFSVGLNPETFRWAINQNSLSETELNTILDVPAIQKLESSQCDVVKEPGKTIRIANLTDTHVREIVNAVATRFKET